MHGYIKRKVEKLLHKKLSNSPVVALLGPRQAGKSTLAKECLKKISSIYLDLQKRSDINKLNEPELFIERYRDKLICLDKIQLKPDFFSYLRSEIDEDRRNGRFLILGSASRDLIRQSSETLAGRISYLDLTPFLFEEIKDQYDWQTILLRGGFPNSLLALDDETSFDWREDFIRTFLERDIPALGFLIPVPVMERLWRLLSHYHGQTINYSKIAGAADISQQTLKKYIAILEQTYMIRILQPYESNLKKRIIKSPKIFLRDSGILHALQDIETFDRLLSHPILGASWEGFAMENIIAGNPRWKPFYLKTSNGAEVDLILKKGTQLKLYEFKASKAPKPSRGFFEIVKDLSPEKSHIIAPVNEPYEYRKNIWVSNLKKKRE
ncbi:MAG: ATPase [Deltaproteobacteria bacterium]|nr:MAG: ATPase [Deltaproteobacteria bacterium]